MGLESFLTLSKTKASLLSTEKVSGNTLSVHGIQALSHNLFESSVHAFACKCVRIKRSACAFPVGRLAMRRRTGRASKRLRKGSLRKSSDSLINDAEYWNMRPRNMRPAPAIRLFVPASAQKAGSVRMCRASRLSRRNPAKSQMAPLSAALACSNRSLISVVRLVPGALHRLHGFFSQVHGTHPFPFLCLYYSGSSRVCLLAVCTEFV